MSKNLELNLEENEFSITKKVELDEDGKPTNLRVNVTSMDEMPLWVSRFKDSLPDLLLELQKRLKDGPFSLSDGAMQGVEISAMEIQRFAINALLRRNPSALRSINPELDALLKEILTLPIQNSTSVRTSAPFENLHWTVSTDVHGELQIPFAVAEGLVGSGGWGHLRDKQNTLWTHAVPLIAKARNPEHVWTIESMKT